MLIENLLYVQPRPLSKRYRVSYMSKVPDHMDLLFILVGEDGEIDLLQEHIFISWSITNTLNWELEVRMATEMGLSYCVRQCREYLSTLMLFYLKSQWWQEDHQTNMWVWEDSRRGEDMWKDLETWQKMMYSRNRNVASCVARIY